jgi:hypothetical protein
MLRRSNFGRAINGFHFHDLRHTGSRLAAAKKPLVNVWSAQRESNPRSRFGRHLLGEAWIRDALQRGTVDRASAVRARSAPCGPRSAAPRPRCAGRSRHRLSPGASSHALRGRARRPARAGRLPGPGPGRQQLIEINDIALSRWRRVAPRPEGEGHSSRSAPRLSLANETEISDTTATIMRKIPTET